MNEYAQNILHACAFLGAFWLGSASNSEDSDIGLPAFICGAIGHVAAVILILIQLLKLACLPA